MLFVQIRAMKIFIQIFIQKFGVAILNSNFYFSSNILKDFLSFSSARVPMLLKIGKCSNYTF